MAYAHGEIDEDIDAVAVPIVNHERAVVAALDALIPQSRARPQHLNNIERILRAGAGLVSSRIGAPSTRTDAVGDLEGYLEQVWSSDGTVQVGPSSRLLREPVG